MTPVSIVISTRNRCDDVLVAIESCLSQEYDAFEVLVYDDASTDATVPTIRKQFPEVQLHASDARRGYLVWRNRGFRDATGEIIVSIDDDAYFTEVDTLSRIAECFREYPQAGAIALPYLEPAHPAANARMAPVEPGTPVRSYVGCAHAVRRHVALECGGYPEFLMHQGEERDLCLKMLQRGYPTLYVDTPPIVHRFSPMRDHNRVDYYGYRNTLLFTGLNAPRHYLIPRLILDSIQLLTHRLSVRTVAKSMYAIGAGWGAIWKYRSFRQPVSSDTYRMFRRRISHGPLSSVAIPQPLLRRHHQCTNS